MNVVQSRLGHQIIQTAVDIYGHVCPPPTSPRRAPWSRLLRRMLAAFSKRSAKNLVQLPECPCETWTKATAIF